MKCIRMWLVIIYTLLLMFAHGGFAHAITATPAATLQPNVYAQVLPSPDTPAVWRMKFWIRFREFIRQITTSVQNSISIFR